MPDDFKPHELFAEQAPATTEEPAPHELFAPDTKPYVPITAAGVDTATGAARASAPRTDALDRLAETATRLEQFKGEQYHIAHNRVFYALSELGFKNVYADFTGRAGVDLQKSVDDRVARLYRDRPEILTADVSEQNRVRSAILIDEALGRASGSREEFVEAASVAGRTMVAKALREAFPEGAPGANTPAGLERQNQVAAAAQRLQSLTPEQWADYATFASRATGEQPRNEVEDAMFSSRHRFAAAASGDPRTADLPTEIGYNLRTITQNPGATSNYVALRRQVQRATNLKKAGVLQGDPFKEGILVANPEADLGYSPLQFLATSTLAEVTRPVAAATTKPPTATDVAKLRLAGAPTDDDARRELEARARGTAAAAVDLALRRESEFGGLPDLTPEAAASLEGTVTAPWRGSGIVARNLYGLMDRVIGVGRQASDAVRDVQRDTMWQELGRTLVSNTRNNNELAAAQRDMFGAITTLAKLSLFGEAELRERARLGQNLDAGALAAYMRESLDIGRLWQHGREAATAEQEERLKRIGAGIATGNPLNVSIGDVFNATVFGAVDGLAQGFVGIIERPESIPLIMAGEKFGDAVLTNGRAALGGMVSRATHAASLKMRLAELGAMRPKFVDDMLAYINNAIERHVQAGTYDEIAPTLNEARARAQVLRDAYADQKTVRADKRDVSAFASAVAKAMPHIEDDLGGLGEELLANVNPTPSTFEWKKLRDAWHAWRGTVPQTVTRDINRFLARTSPVDLVGMAARIANPTTQVDGVAELTAQLDAATTPEERAEIAAKLIDFKGSVNHEGGMAGLLRDVHEMNTLAGNADPAAQARMRELAGRLTDPGKLTEMDTATLRVIGDLVANKATHRVWDTLANVIHKTTGGRLFSSGKEIGDFTAAVKALESFNTQHAQNLYVAKLMNGLRSMRLNRVYEYAIAKVEGEISANLIAAGGDEAAVAPLRDTLTQLRAEHRAALTRPVDAPWEFDETKLGRRLVRPDEFVKLVKDDPLLFGVAPDARVLGDGPTHEEAFNLAALDKQVKEAKLAIEGVKELHKATAGLARLPAWMLKAVQNGTDPARLATMAHDRRKVIRQRQDDINNARLALERGEKATPEQQAAFVKTMLDKVDQAEAAGLPKDVATIYRAFIDAVPRHYWTSEVRLNLKTGGKPGTLGDYSTFARLINIFDHSDPTTFFHEFGHHMLHALLEDSEVVELRKIFDADYTPAATGVREFDEYMNQFTEWFARRFSAYAQTRVLPATSAAGVFERAWQRFLKGINVLRRAFITTEVEPPAEAWMKRFFAGEAATVGSPLEAGNLLSRERWHNLRRQVGAPDRALASPEQVIELKELATTDLPGMAQSLIEEQAAITAALPHLEKVAAAKGKLDPTMPSSLPFDWEALETRLAGDMRAAQARLESGRGLLTLPEEHAAAMMNMLGNPGVDADMRNALASVERVRSAATGHSFLDPNFDLATVAAMPFWDQARVLREFRRTTAQRITVHGQRLADLGAAFNRMEDADRSALTAALTRGTPVDQALLDKYPAIKRILPHRGDPATARADNLNGWLRSEGEAQATLIEAAHRAGFIDDATLAGLERKGYSPHLYGMYERPALVTSRKFREAKRAIKGGQGSGIDVGKDGTELMFARDLAKWRVRAREADGYVHDELFDTAKAAQQYVRRKFGSETLAGMKRTGEAYDVGQTAFGDEVVIADPIGDEADVLDLLTGTVRRKVDAAGKPTGEFVATEHASPIGRLEAFSKLNRDLHIHAMLETLQEFGLVLRPDEFHATLANRPGGVADFSNQYVQLPNSAQSFGNLRGAYVHRRVLSELNSINHSYDQLKTWVEALGDVYIRHGLTPPTEVLGEAPGRLATFDRAWGLAIKTTQIVQNFAAIFSNISSNLLFGMMAAGPDMFSFRNLDGWVTAIRDVMGDVPREILDALPLIGRSKHLRSAKYTPKSESWDAAIKHGVIDGALFDRIDNRDLRDGLLRVTGLVGPDAPALKKRLAKLQNLLGEKARLVAEGKSASGIANIELEIAAVEEALRHNDRGMLRRMADWAGGLLGFTYRNSFGTPTNSVTALLRDTYGRLDDVFKYSAFLHLRKSMPDEQAAWHVKTFMQNYANVPAAITQLGRSPVGALVPSFGYEMGRIFVNSLRHKPLRAMGLMGSVYALNAVSAATAGVPFERVDELQRSTGYKDWFSRFINSATTLNVYDPRTKDIAGSYGVGATFIPIYGFLDSQGAVSVVVDEYIPDEARTGLMAPVAAALQGAGNFVGGRPYLNALAGLAFNRDPATGRPLVSEDPLKVSWWDRARAAWHVIGKGLIPPLAPGGRQFAQIWDAYDSPVHPDTGKPVSGSTPAQAIVRSLTNINLKGTASYRVAQLLDAVGAGSGKPEPTATANDATILKSLMWEVRGLAGGSAPTETPLFGDDAAERRLWAAWVSEQDPARRKEAEVAFRTQLSKSREIYVRGKRVTTGRDEHEIFLAMKAGQERGSDTQFARLTPEQQAHVIAGMDAVGDVHTVSELVRLAKFNADHTRLNLESNPYAVQAAQRVILDWMKEGRARAPTLEYLDYLQRIERRAFGASRRAQIRHRARTGASQ